MFAGIQEIELEPYTPVCSSFGVQQITLFPQKRTIVSNKFGVVSDCARSIVYQFRAIVKTRLNSAIRYTMITGQKTTHAAYIGKFGIAHSAAIVS